MVDRKNRDFYAEVLRHFAAGRIPVDEYEHLTHNLTISSQDEAIAQIWADVWMFYDDFRTERMCGEWRLAGANREYVKRSILFLHTDHELEWLPKHSGGCLLNLLTLTTWDRVFDKQWQEEFQQQGDFACYPFLRHDDLEGAKRIPLFFAPNELSKK